MIWDPFEEIQRMHEEMDQLFNSFIGCRHQQLGYIEGQSTGKELAKCRQEYRVPVSHVYETENSVIATVELPGVDKKDIELNITEDSFEVQVSRKQENKVEKDGALHYGIQTTSFYRKVPMPVEVAVDKAKATFNNGIVRIEVPKANPKDCERGRRLELD